ncbi:MAG TPA: branched-chain amino acid ABC transporter substrate-binding protein [Thermoanaerobaculia bacterium]|nr:branched-chain amino acid ABC transporter substrate-binding protein [Thermoanaerobaculia bacterium]
MTKYRDGFTAIIVGFLAVFLACQRAPEAQMPEIRIGVEGPFEGSNAHIGRMIMNAVKLRFDQSPAKSYKVTLVPIDDKSNPSDAVSALQGVVGEPKLVAMIAFYNSSTALAGKPIVQEAKLPVLIYSASNPAVTDSAPYYFRLVPTDDNQAVELSAYARKLGARSAAILYFADEYGKGLADGIRARASGDGYKVTSVRSYDATTVDFRPLLTLIKREAPDVIFICGFVEKSIAILNQAAERGLKAKFLAGDGTFNEEQLIQGAGANAEGIYVAAPYVFNEANQKNKSFLDAYWSVYDKEGLKQKPASWTAFAYDAAGILQEALGSGCRDRACIQRHLHGMNSPQNAYDGIAGLTYFNPKGDAVGRKFSLAVVKEQKFAAAE